MLRHLDGFDYYTNADIPMRWTSSSQASISSGSGRFSSGAMEIMTGGQNFARKVLDNQQTWVVGAAYCFLTSLPAPGATFAILRVLDGSNLQVDLRLNSSGTLTVTRNGTTLGTGTRALVPNVFYYLELKVVVAGGTSGSIGLQIGGASELSITGINTSATGNAFANTIELGASGGQGGAGPSMLIDDCYVFDGTGSANNTFAGDVRVECIRPTGAGNYSQFAQTGGTSPNHWTSVNGTSQDGDTSYLSSNTTGQFDTFTFGSLSSNASSIFAIQTAIVARKDDAGSRSIASDIRVGGVDYPGASVGLADSYVYFNEIRETNPATSAPWTASDVNSLEAGIKLVG